MARDSTIYHREDCPLVRGVAVTRFHRSQIGSWATSCATCRPDEAAQSSSVRSSGDSPAGAAITRQNNEPSLAETLDWLKGRIDDQVIEEGITRRTQLFHNQCSVRFTAQSSPFPLFIQTDFSLTNIGSVELEEATDQLWRSTSVVFRSPGGRQMIHTVKQMGELFRRPGYSTSEDLNVFRWRLGSVCLGCSNTFKDIGERINKAFTHAVKLCGGGEPF